MLRRIIEASSKSGDLILDPFCGCGTTIAAANGLGRRWVGIDIDSHAIEIMLERLQDKTIPTYGIPADFRSAERMANTDPFGFETWAVQRIPGFAPNTKQVGDGGIDGRGTLAVKPDDYPSKLALAQVKGGKKPPLDGLRAFCSVADRQRAAIGCYMILNHYDNPREAAHMGRIRVAGQEYKRLNFWSIEDYFRCSMPHLPLMVNPYTGKALAQGKLF